MRESIAKLQVIPLNGTKYTARDGLPVLIEEMKLSLNDCTDESTLNTTTICGESKHGTLYQIHNQSLSKTLDWNYNERRINVFEDEWQDILLCNVKSFTIHPMSKYLAIIGTMNGNYYIHQIQSDRRLKLITKPTNTEVVKCVACKNTYAFLMKDGIIYTMGNLIHGLSGNSEVVNYSFQMGLERVDMPTETVDNHAVQVKFVDVFGGVFHFVALSQSGKLYSWGSMFSNHLHKHPLINLVIRK
jgi:hypothetical protein